ncbi:MAG: hypothetical protein ACTHKX_10730 [Pseudolysinimonas sp.]
MAAISKLTLDIWIEDAIVLFDWLQNVDLDLVPADHKAVKQALVDLLNQLEQSVPPSESVEDWSERVAVARHEVSKDMGW